MVMIYISQDGKLAGFNQVPKSVYDVSESGFRTDKITLSKLASESEGELREFLDAIVRYNAIDTYLSTFISGIKDHTDSHGMLHPKFMQAVTATGRLSSRDPNFQNNLEVKHFLLDKLLSLDLLMVKY